MAIIIKTFGGVTAGENILVTDGWEIREVKDMMIELLSK
jgi:hypothetical protein